MTLPVTEGLLFHYKLDEGVGQIVHDTSGNENHGYLGSRPTPDDYDPAWGVVGALLTEGNYITGHDLVFADAVPYTYGALLRWAGSDPTDFVIPFGYRTEPQDSIYLAGVRGAKDFRYRDSAGETHDVLTGVTAPLFDGGWHSVIWTVGSDRRVTLYIDGASVGSRVISNTSMRLMHIGRGYFTAGYEWDGEIGQVLAYDRALSPEEITQTVAAINDIQRAKLVDFSADVLSGSIPLTVQFTGLSPYHNDPERTYLWDFGDGSTSTEANPSHTYAAGGFMTVSLTLDGHTRTKPNYINIKGDYAAVIERPALTYIRDGNPVAVGMAAGFYIDPWFPSNPHYGGDPLFCHVRTGQPSHLFNGRMELIATLPVSKGYLGFAMPSPTGKWLIFGQEGEYYGKGTVYFYEALADITADTPLSSLSNVYRPHNPDGMVAFSTDRAYPNSAYIMWVEYPTSAETDNQRIIRVNEAGEFETVLSVDSTTIRHFHHLAADPHSPGTLYASTGDISAHVRMYKSADYGDTWTEVAGGSQFFRTLNQVFDEDYVYWATDGTIEELDGHSAFVRAPKSDISAVEVLFTIPNPNLVSYGVQYCYEPHGILIYLRTWHASVLPVASAPTYFYSFDTGRVYEVMNTPLDVSGGGFDSVIPFQSPTDGLNYAAFGGKAVAIRVYEIGATPTPPAVGVGVAACIPPIGGGARYGVEESVYNTFTTENVNKGVYLTTAKVKTTNPNADEASLEYTNDTTSITLNTTPIDVDATYTVKTAPITIDANETDTLRVSVKNSTTCNQSTNYVESLSLIPVSGDDVLYPQDLAFISGVKPSQKRKVEVK